jgi:hypothetical protein
MQTSVEALTLPLESSQPTRHGRLATMALASPWLCSSCVTIAAVDSVAACALTLSVDITVSSGVSNPSTRAAVPHHQAPAASLAHRRLYRKFRPPLSLLLVQEAWFPPLSIPYIRCLCHSPRKQAFSLNQTTKTTPYQFYAGVIEWSRNIRPLCETTSYPIHATHLTAGLSTTTLSTTL